VRISAAGKNWEKDEGQGIFFSLAFIAPITDCKHSTFVASTWQVDFSPSMHRMETELLKSLKLAVAVLISVFSLAVWAKPAPWYWWASKVENTRLCLQTSPGNGWYQDGGPYRNSRCNDFVPR